jgi:hypothetical protein
MKRFATLLWLEYRHSRVWAVALIGSLAFWAWGLFQVRYVGPSEQLGVRMAVLVIASMIGALVLALMVGRIRSETRGGQYQVLLLTPPSGYLHVAARYLFGISTAAIYYIIIGGLAWWSVRLSGLPLDAGSVAQLTLAVPFYLLGVTIVPFLAWTLLLMIFISAYRVSGPGWIPGTVMILGTPFALRWLVSGIVRVSGSLPTWGLLRGLQETVYQMGTETSDDTLLKIVGLPQEPLWIMLALAVVLVLVAGRIWQEVEG